MKSGPVTPAPLRCSMMAAQIAMMCASLNVPRSDVPRCPDVPNDTRCVASPGSGFML
jgi:hypothetical protein